MEINTKHFGIVEIDEEKLLDFPEGLPGFEMLKRFIIIDNQESEIPIMWLQSIEDMNIAFVLIDPFFIKSDYEIDVDDGELEIIDIKDVKDVLVYSIVVVPEDIKKMTANLRAPLLINVKNNKGKQVVLHNSNYDVKYRIFQA